MSRYQTIRQIKDLLIEGAIGTKFPAEYLACLTLRLESQFLVGRPIDFGILASRKTGKHDAKDECRQRGPSQFRDLPEQASGRHSGHYEPD